MFCPQCGHEVLEGTTICPKCEFKFKESCNIKIDENEKEASHKMKGKYKVIISLVLVLIIGLLGYFGYNGYLKQQMKNYITEVNTYVSEIEGTIEDITIVNGAWDIVDKNFLDTDYVGVPYSIFNYAYNAVKSQVTVTFSDEFDDAEHAHNLVGEQYKKLREYEIKNSDMEEINDKVVKINSQYEDVYSDVILSEIGGNSTEIKNLKNDLAQLKRLIRDTTKEWKITLNNATE